jgi:hypothetical protein
MDAEQWTVEHYYAAIRRSELKPTEVPTVFIDPQGELWYVPDARPKTPQERRVIFARLEKLRGRV